MDIRARRSSREISPDRAKVCLQPRAKPFRKVQVVYYLSRNGQLEHPHYMEVTHLANQQLRLKGKSNNGLRLCLYHLIDSCLINFPVYDVIDIDVMERLTVLRGKGMPSLYSWSCKR